MKFLPYILKHLRRNWIRTTSTVVAMAACVFLFCVLQTVVKAVNQSMDVASASRLVVRHAVGLTQNVPLAYKARIASVPGVKRVATNNWYGGYRGAEPDFNTFFMNFAVDGEEYLSIYPEFAVSPAERAAFLADRRGCIIGRGLAEKWGWKVGSTFQLQSEIPPYRAPQPLEFIVRGIYAVDKVKHPATDETMMFFHYEYMRESVAPRPIGAGTYVVEIENPDQAAQVSKAIDALFENSDAQTKTETESAFMASFIALAGNLTFLLNMIGTAVAFTILLVTANTMSMAVRERRTEVAVLKTLGFSSTLIMILVLGEAIVIGLLGGGLGLLLASGLIRIMPSMPMIGALIEQTAGDGLPLSIAALGFTFAVLLALGAGLVPSVSAYRARITDMLRTV